MRQVLFNMSGVYVEEGFRPEGCGWLDLSGLEGTNCYCSAESTLVIRDQVRETPVHAIHWIDTGDYHYLTKFFLKRIGTPFQLVLFDNHSDRQRSAFGGALTSCGSWVTEALEECPNLQNVFTVGISDGSSLRDGLPVYLSIDLDILSPACFRTGWSQGTMTVGQLQDRLSAVLEHHPTLGIDVCGGLTASKGATDEDLRLNRDVRLAMTKFLYA